MQHSLGQWGLQHLLVPLVLVLPHSAMVSHFAMVSSFQIRSFAGFPISRYPYASKKNILKNFNSFPDCIPGLIPYSLLLLSMSSLDNFQPFRFTAIPSKVFHPQINATILFLKARGKYIESTQMFGKYIKARLVSTKTLTTKTFSLLQQYNHILNMNRAGFQVGA